MVEPRFQIRIKIQKLMTEGGSYVLLFYPSSNVPTTYVLSDEILSFRMSSCSPPNEFQPQHQFAAYLSVPQFQFLQLLNRFMVLPCVSYRHFSFPFHCSSKNPSQGLIADAFIIIGLSLVIFPLTNVPRMPEFLSSKGPSMIPLLFGSSFLFLISN